MLQSKINETGKPALYISPNKQLAEQVRQEAKKFGIQYCDIEDPGNTISPDFQSGKKILITHAQKVFNGRSIFGIESSSQNSGTILLDDSHSCIDSIRSSFVIRVKRDCSLYEEVFELFREDIKSQGAGTFVDIEAREYGAALPVPYWCLHQKKEDLVKIIAKHNQTCNEVKFPWPLIKDDLYNMQVHVSGRYLEISPYYTPIEKYRIFSNADQRILMSATTQDDGYFVSGLGFSPLAVRTPLTDPDSLWSGEKMVLIPSLINDRLDRNLVITELIKRGAKGYGTVALTTSQYKAESYKQLGAVVSSSYSIEEDLNQLREKKFSHPLVLVNRYDGIDLPDNACRILVLDSKPHFESLVDKYEESCRPNSDKINLKLAQKIEQGFGRSVRGEKDYSIIILIGNDLVKFIRGHLTKGYFSTQTQKQIDIGIEVSESAKGDVLESDHAFKVIEDLIIQAIETRDQGWKDYYTVEMNKIVLGTNSEDYYNLLEKERIAYQSVYRRNFDKGIKLFQEIIDQSCESNEDRGWYLQEIARAKMDESLSESAKSQLVAYNKSRNLLLPPKGVTYKKLKYYDGERANKIRTWISKFSDQNERSINLNGILSDLSFGTDSKKFEEALKSIGEILGFQSERPDKEYKTGPDNLWCVGPNKYLLFECKNEVELVRDVIIKSEAGQLNTHLAWFKDNYPKADVDCFIIIPTIKLAKEASIAEGIRSINYQSLNRLKAQIGEFLKEFKGYESDSITDELIMEKLSYHKLNPEDFRKEYSSEIRSRK